MIWLEQRLWSALRVMSRHCEVPPLALAADCARAKAQRWINQLEGAGYVRAHRAPGQQWPSYRLIRNTGPKAPMHEGAVPVFADANTGERFHIITRAATGEPLRNPGWQLLGERPRLLAQMRINS